MRGPSLLPPTSLPSLMLPWLLLLLTSPPAARLYRQPVLQPLLLLLQQLAQQLLWQLHPVLLV